LKNCLLLLFFIFSTHLKAQWHPIAAQKINKQEAFLFFYDYFFEAEKAQEISIYNDSIFFEKLNTYRLSRPNYLLEVYLPNQKLYRYYCLRSRADGQEIAVIESNFKQLLKNLVREEQYAQFLKKSIPASAVVEGFFYEDQFFFQGESQLTVSLERKESLEDLKILRAEVLTTFLKIVKEDLANSK